MFILLEIGFERDRVGQLAAFDQLAASLEDAAVTPIGEMFRAQNIRHALVGGVVIKDRAKKGSLRFKIVRRHAIEHHFGVGAMVRFKRGKKGI